MCADPWYEPLSADGSDLCQLTSALIPRTQVQAVGVGLKGRQRQQEGLGKNTVSRRSHLTLQKQQLVLLKHAANQA
jgi:hypothetical protein